MMNNSTNSLNDDEGVHHVAVWMERSHRVHDLIVVPGFGEVDLGLKIRAPRGIKLELYLVPTYALRRAKFHLAEKGQ